MTHSILLVTSGIFHPPYPGRRAVQAALRPMPGFAFQHISSLEKLPADLDGVSALGLYFHHKILSETALRRLEAFVHGGGGILALHSATASFKQSAPYFRILGGRFIGHGPVQNFELQPSQAGIFGGIPSFTIKDELYLHELQPGIEVHFTAKHEGQDVPVVWTFQYGAGRVCYAVPGHTSASMSHPAVQAILRRGLSWVCGEA